MSRPRRWKKRRYFGKMKAGTAHSRDEFIRYKRQEWTAYHQTVSDWEIERYSHLF